MWLLHKTPKIVKVLSRDLKKKNYTGLCQENVETNVYLYCY